MHSQYLESVPRADRCLGNKWIFKFFRHLIFSHRVASMRGPFEYADVFQQIGSKDLLTSSLYIL